MTLQEKILTHWNVPIKVLAWQKFVLENRNLVKILHLADWKQIILTIDDFSEEESALLRHVIECIDPTVTHYDTSAFYSLISETYSRYAEERFVVLKYADSVTYGDLWNNWYRYTRGVVVDLKEVELVTFNLPKFFNLFEKPETQLPIVLDKMNRGSVTQYIKEDGSNVSVSVYEETLFVNTPGGFDSEQAISSSHLLRKQHSLFLQALQNELSDYTFVFEYVSPFNQIVVHYLKEELILLHVLDKRTGHILNVEDVQALAKKFQFRPCQTVSDDFMTLIEDSKDAVKYPAQEHEGWVVRIDQENEVFFLKLKCSDYAKLHRVIAQALNPRWILESIKDETIDDKISQIESESIREMVLKMIKIFFEWNEQKHQQLLAEFSIFPEELWLDDLELDRYLTFNRLISDQIPTTPDSYRQRVFAFLESFSKGKLDNPKEELIVLAQKVAEMVKEEFSYLSSYDAYKMKISIWITNFMRKIKEVIESFTRGQSYDIEFTSFLVTYFGDYQGFIHEEWELIFENQKDEYLQLMQTKRENLRPHLFEMHDYAKKRFKFINLQKTMLISIKQQILQFLLRDASLQYVELESLIPQELKIDETTRTFYLTLCEFETNRFFTLVPPDLHKEKANTVLKEVLSILRGNESDDAFSVAKDIFMKLPENIKDQRAYYQSRGAFSSFVNRKVKGIFKPVFFELFNITSVNRMDTINEHTFYSLIDVVTDSSVTTLNEYQVDFREIQSQINESNTVE